MQSSLLLNWTALAALAVSLGWGAMSQADPPALDHSDKATVRLPNASSKLKRRICQNGSDTTVWYLPAGFPCPRIPEDNPVTEARAELGRHLFYDNRLSRNQAQSCSSCHQQRLAFTDGKPRAVGSTGESHHLSSMSLANVAYTSVLTWDNPNVKTLEQQALVPIFGHHPVELDLAGKDDLLLKRLKSDGRYVKMFYDAFPHDQDPITIKHVAQAIASFERTLISGGSPYDRYRYAGDENAISEAAKRGEELFFSERCSCSKCHTGFAMSGSVDYAGKQRENVEFHNTGLYNMHGATSYPAGAAGLYEVTHNPHDVGKFRAPTLRNVAVTAPYMHDGSVPTLEDVVEHYNAGGRTITSGPHAGVGADNPNKSDLIKPLHLTDREKKDLIEFLRSLTDEELLTNPRLSDPWPQLQSSQLRTVHRGQ